jgi:integrase
MVAKKDFTDRTLKALKPAPAGKRIILWDAQIPGFGIRVTDKSCAADIGAFVLVTRYPGAKTPAPRRIGGYPAMSLGQARQIAREWRELIAQGVDPKRREEERQREEARRRADTFAAAFAAYADDRLTTLRTGAQVTGAIAKHVLPLWGMRPMTELRRADVNELIRSIRKDAPISANRVLTYLKTFFIWAVDQDLIEASPAAAVRRPSKEVRRDRVLTDQEVVAIWRGCENLGSFGRAFRFMLASGQRRNEVGGMRWDELDLNAKTWTLARERTKADRAHEVPLSDLALSIINECPKLDGFVFSAGRGAAPCGWSNAKSRIDKSAPVSGWHLHDLRRTCATNLAKLGVDRLVISRILNHADDAVTGIYDRHRYDHEKRRALDLWGQRLMAIVNGTDGGNVVRLAELRATV